MSLGLCPRKTFAKISDGPVIIIEECRGEYPNHRTLCPVSKHCARNKNIFIVSKSKYGRGKSIPWRRDVTTDDVSEAYYSKHALCV